MFCTFSIQLKWSDERIQLENLKSSDKMVGNLPIKSNIDEDEKKKNNWIPKLRFGNSHTDVAIVNDEFASVVILFEGNPTLNSISNLKENQLYRSRIRKSLCLCLWKSLRFSIVLRVSVGDVPVRYSTVFDKGNFVWILSFHNFNKQYSNCMLTILYFMLLSVFELVLNYNQILLLLL